MSKRRPTDPIAWEANYQYSSDFDDKTIAREILTYRLNPDVDYQDKILAKIPDNSEPFICELYKYPVLTRHGERMLFLKMNCAKHKASKLRARGGRIRDIDRYHKIAVETRNLIAEHNLRLVASLAKKITIPTMTFNDLVSNGNMSLFNAIDKFDVNRKNDTGNTNKFSTYATWAINNGLYSDRKKILARQLPVINDDVSSFLTIIAKSEEEELRRDDSDDAEMLLKRMTDRAIITQREEDILRDRFGINDAMLSLGELGEIHGITKERVRQIQCRAIEKLRDALEVTVKKRSKRSKRGVNQVDAFTKTNNKTNFRGVAISK